MDWRTLHTQVCVVVLFHALYPWSFMFLPATPGSRISCVEDIEDRCQKLLVDIDSSHRDSEVLHNTPSTHQRASLLRTPYSTFTAPHAC